MKTSRNVRSFVRSVCCYPEGLEITKRSFISSPLFFFFLCVCVAFSHCRHHRPRAARLQN